MKGVVIFLGNMLELQTQEAENVNFDRDMEVVKLVVSADTHWANNTRTNRTPVAFYTTYDTAKTLMTLVREVNVMVEECLQADSLSQLVS